jgi:hypothetical protein
LAIAVGNSLARLAGFGVRDREGYIRHSSARRIRYGSDDGRFLRECLGSKKTQEEQRD